MAALSKPRDLGKGLVGWEALALRIRKGRHRGCHEAIRGTKSALGHVGHVGPQHGIRVVRHLASRIDTTSAVGESGSGGASSPSSTRQRATGTRSVRLKRKTGSSPRRAASWTRFCPTRTSSRPQALTPLAPRPGPGPEMDIPAWRAPRGSGSRRLVQRSQKCRIDDGAVGPWGCPGFPFDDRGHRHPARPGDGTTGHPGPLTDARPFLRLGQLGRHHLSHEVGDGLWDRWSGKRHEVARYTPAERWLASISADP